METKNLYQRISAIAGELGTLKKEGTNTYRNYHYVTDAQLMEALRPLCVKHGVVILPSVDESEQVTPTITKITASFQIINADQPEERYTNVFVGYGADSQDKGPYKAMTGAMKSFLMKTFMVASEDDPEKDERPAPRAAQQAKPAPRNGAPQTHKTLPALDYKIETMCSKQGQAIGKILTEDPQWLKVTLSNDTRLSLLSEMDQANLKLAARQLQEKQQ